MYEEGGNPVAGAGGANIERSYGPAARAPCVPVDGDAKAAPRGHAAQGHGDALKAARQQLPLNGQGRKVKVAVAAAR